MDLSPPGSSVRGDFPGKNAGVGCHGLSPEDLPHPGTEPVSAVSPALAGGFFTTCTTWEAPDLKVSRTKGKNTTREQCAEWVASKNSLWGFKDAAALHGLTTGRTIPMAVTPPHPQTRVKSVLEQKVLQRRTRPGCPGHARICFSPEIPHSANTP